MSERTQITVGAVALCMIAAGVWLHFYGAASAPAPVTATAPVAEGPSPATAPSPNVAPAPPEPPIRYPIDATAGKAGHALPQDLQGVLIGLFDRKVVAALFQLDDFPRRVVATVDNLGRPYAPTAVWPVHPAGGRFTVEHSGDSEVISPRNTLRYAPYVGLIERVDLHQVVAVYARFYPLFQEAYQGIGYPKGYFNDRLVEVIDELLATPEITAPLTVHAPELTGPLQPSRPWVLYRFDDPKIESLTAGQKILLRMGPSEARRVKVRLADLRRLIAAGEPARSRVPLE